eukprot:NODE_235_length_13458_cov_0.279737.p7 type:complete len:232 gc:universal NODE_235_length_13458_cov_0.279737:10312-9617(-)
MATAWMPYSKVFAKVPGFPYWPGAIIPQEKYPSSIGKPSEKQMGVLFYGSMDFGMVRVDLMKDFDENYSEFAKTRRKDLQKAIIHAQEVSPLDLINSISPDLYKAPAVVEDVKSVESPRKSSSFRKSKRKKTYHSEMDKIVKIKRYLGNRIYGNHNLKVNIAKIDKAVCWLSSLTDINFKVVEESRIGHVLAYIAFKPPKNEVGRELIEMDIPHKCKILIDRWKASIKNVT